MSNIGCSGEVFTGPNNQTYSTIDQIRQAFEQNGKDFSQVQENFCVKNNKVYFKPVTAGGE